MISRSVFYSFSVQTSNPDVSGMLRFLTDELQAAEDAGQRVWILGHVLPGSSLLIYLVIWWLPTRFTTGWDGTSALLNGPNLLYQIIDRFSPHVIANVFMGHIHDEVRYIYYACVKCRIIPCLSLLIHKVETMVPSWTAQPRWLPLGSGALLPLWLDWILVRVYAVPHPTPLLISID